MIDAQWSALPRGGTLDHAYGPNVHLLSDPWSLSVLARLCQPDVVQPEVNRLVSRLYDHLLSAVAARELLTRPVEVPTRMAAQHPVAGVYRGEAIRRDQRVVVVDIARAGMLPSARVYESLHDVIDPAHLRQDHIVASRATNAAHEVVGVQLDGSKIGGPVDGATVLFPDPMAATGTSLCGVIQRYLQADGGRPRRIVSLHLVVTPEFLARVARELPDLVVYAIRLDRGLSPPEVLATRPGARWAEERGLNERQYIVPGAGGMGEVLNNAWV